MKHLITAVEPGSIAEQLGISAGDHLVSINNKTILDWIDYQSLCAEEKLELVTEHEGEELEYSLEKDDYEPLGLRFETMLMSPLRSCVNKCIFCFVDQLPEHVRPTLGIKDDDWRMSLMTGSYVTLTNTNDSELERIIERKASPLYISVHTTEMPLREQMLGQPLAKRLMKQLNRLKEGGIRFHAQAVLCPGINDGAHLERTINDLSALYPACQSLALVPVGLTCHREGLCELHPYTRDEARAVLDIASKARQKLLKKLGTEFVYPSDEFYLIAEKRLPSDEEYGEYDQIENGVGLLRMFESEFHAAFIAEQPENVKREHVLIPCGVSAYEFMDNMLRKHFVPGKDVELVRVENTFFGETVTVTGLLTGGDILRALEGKTADRVLITECMLREQENVFLDDMTVEELSGKLGMPVQSFGRHGEDLFDALYGEEA